MNHPVPAKQECVGCGGEFHCSDGPVHPYMESSPACWAAFGELLAVYYSDRSFADIYRLGVDAYAVQHPGSDTTDRRSIQSTGMHLIRLCLFFEHGLKPKDANQAIVESTIIKSTFWWLEPPSSRGTITVADVACLTDVDENRKMLNRWAECAWDAWQHHHTTIRQWLYSSDQLSKRITKR